MTITERSQYFIKQVKAYAHSLDKPLLSRLTFRHQDDYLDACALLQEVYEALHDNLGCGLGTEAHLYLPENRLLARRRQEEDTGEISRIAQELSGIKFRMSYDDLNYIIFTFNDTAKSCTVKSRQDFTTDVFLDFATLAAENQTRYKDWRQMLPDLAKAVIDRCKFCLERYSGRFLGIPDALWVTDFNGKAMLNSEVTFQFREKAIPYAKLNDNQLRELFEMVNSKLQHGQMAYTRFKSDEISIQMIRQPYSDSTESPYFDYEVFCRQYDELTPGLQKILQKIVDDLIVVPAEVQISSLAPMHHFIYLSSEGNYERCKDSFTHSPHRQHLHEAIRTAHPNIVINDMPGFQYDPKAKTYSIAIDYTIPPDLIATDDALITQQLAIDSMINDIKTNHIQDIAAQLVANLLDRLDEMGIAEATNGIWDTPRSLTYLDCNIVEISYKAKTYSINLTEVHDPEFVAKIEDAVYQLSEGLFTVRIKQEVYFINTNSLSK